jgi:hypothetical protein
VRYDPCYPFKRIGNLDVTNQSQLKQISAIMHLIK